jgi:hypothetical protein
MNKQSIQVVLTTLLVVLGVGAANAQSPIVNEEAKLLPADGSSYDYFGGSVAISGNRALIGVYGDDDNGSNSGSAYVFNFDGSTWQEEAKLLPSDGASHEKFGISAAISGDTLVVGAYTDDDNGVSSGSAYIYRFDGSTWQEEAKLLASDGASYDVFGYSVAIDGDLVLVGAYWDDDNGQDSGSAYIYRFDGSTWQEEAKLIASDGTSPGHFGKSVAISGNLALIGTPYGSASGSAYIYRFDGKSWQEETKLIPSDGSDGAPDDYFGGSVAISGNLVLIGAQDDDPAGNESGSAYIYRFDGNSWQEEAKLIASDGASDARFGSSVSISGNLALIGVRNDADNGSNSGSAYVFNFDGSTWQEETKLLPSDGASSDYFGNSVSISGDLVLIGAGSDDDNGSASGSAYIFGTAPPCQLNGDLNGDDVITAADVLILISNWGGSGIGDLNGDGVVAAADLLILIENWGTSCP